MFSLYDYEVVETVKETAKSEKATHTIGNVIEVNPRKRYGFNGVTFSSIDSALIAYEACSGIDFSIPALSFLNDKANEAVISHASAMLTHMRLAPEHFFMRIGDKTLEKCKVVRRDVTSTEKTALKRYNEARHAITSASATIVNAQKAIKSHKAHIRMIERRYLLKKTDYCYYIDVFMPRHETEAMIAEAEATIAEAEATIAEANATIAETKATRFYVVADVYMVKKNYDQKIIGYVVWDSTRDVEFTVKTVANGMTAIKPNDYTPHIISELMIEPTITYQKHGMHRLYTYKFKQVARTEVKAC